jgi:2,3-bisphosphoglycerate-independent phosphoglycerate mutase
VLVHVEAPDEAGHNGDARGKVAALEQIDEHIVGPVHEKLQTFDQWRMLVMPDHPTPVPVRSHTEDPVPWVIAGTRVPNVVSLPYTEAAAEQSDLHVEAGHELMEYFLKD